MRETRTSGRKIRVPNDIAKELRTDKYRKRIVEEKLDRIKHKNRYWEEELEE